MGNNVPRRNVLTYNVPAELAIRNAIDRIETMGADIRLTEIVTMLGRALDLLGDVVDEGINDDNWLNGIPKNTKQQNGA